MLVLLFCSAALAVASPGKPLPHECRPWEKVCGICKDCSRCRYCTGGGECSVKREAREKRERAAGLRR